MIIIAFFVTLLKHKCLILGPCDSFDQPRAQAYNFCWFIHNLYFGNNGLILSLFGLAKATSVWSPELWWLLQSIISPYETCFTWQINILTLNGECLCWAIFNYLLSILLSSTVLEYWPIIPIYANSAERKPMII